MCRWRSPMDNLGHIAGRINAKDRVFLLYGGLAAVYIGMVFFLMASLLFGWARRAFGFVGLVLAISAVVMLKRNTVRRGWRTLALAVRGGRKTNVPPESPLPK